MFRYRSDTELKARISTESRKRDARERILKVAYELFIVDKLYEKTTIREIAKRAEVSVGAVYLHFKKKADILAALIAVTANGAKRALLENLPAEGTGYERLAALLANFETHRKSAVMYAPPVPKQAVDFDPAVLSAIERELTDFVTMVSDIVAAGIEDGSIRAFGPAKLQAAVILQVYTTFVRDLTLKLSPLSFADVVPSTVDAFIDMLLQFLRSALSTESGPGRTPTA